METISELAKLFEIANKIGVFSMRQAKEIAKSFESFWNGQKPPSRSVEMCSLSLESDTCSIAWAVSQL